ncbi:MAG: hypothetical protein ACJ76V_13290 [Thermoleophilaceae bacterium]
MKAMNYQYLPFQAFGDDGRIITPVEVPADWKQAYAESQNLPAWSSIVEQISLLGVERGHYYAAGLGFVKDSIRLFLVKSMTSSGTPENGRGAIDTLLALELKNILDLGGKRYLIPRSWLDAINKVLELLSGGKGGNGGGDPAGFAPEREAELIASLEPFDDAKANAINAVLVLRALVTLLGAVELPRSVRATVLWYKPLGLGAQPISQAERAAWLAQVGDYRASGFMTPLREIGLLWDQAQRSFPYQPLNNAMWGPPLMPYSPLDICRAFYGVCSVPKPAEAEEVVAAAGD